MRTSRLKSAITRRFLSSSFIRHRRRRLITLPNQRASFARKQQTLLFHRQFALYIVFFFFRAYKLLVVRTRTN